LADVDQGRRGKRSQAFLGGWWRHRHGKNTTIPETVAEGRERLLYASGDVAPEGRYKFRYVAD